MGAGHGRRRRRLHCALRCQVFGLSRRPIEARVVRIGEGGLSVVGPLRVERGESIRVRMMHHRKTGAVEVTAFVWNDEPARGALARAGMRMVGCQVPDPPKAFLRLLSQIEERSAAPLERRIPAVRARPTETPGSERDLPRPRELAPPPKPEPEETLPTFRIRLKQLGGPRTRSLAVRAYSVAEAEALARKEIESQGGDGTNWELVEVVIAS